MRPADRGKQHGYGLRRQRCGEDVSQWLHGLRIKVNLFTPRVINETAGLRNVENQSN